MSDVTVRAYASFIALAPLAEEIDALNARSRRPCPFSTYEFQRTYVDNDEFFPEQRGLEILFLCAFDGPRLVGFLALRRKRGWFGKTVEFLVTHDTDRPHMIAAPEDEPRCAQAFMHYLFEVDRDWSMLNFAQQETSVPPASALLSAAPRQHLFRAFECMPNSTLAIHWATPRDYFRSLSKKHRQNTERGARRLFDAGVLEHVFSNDAKMRDTLLDLYLTVEARSWKHSAAGTIGRDARRVQFFHELCSAAQPLALSFHFLCLDGVPIAGMINGSFNNTLYAMQISHDAAYDPLGPGNLLLLLSIEQAIEERCRAFNLLSGFSYYKERWLARTTPTHSVQVFKPYTLRHLKVRLGDLKRVLLSLRPQAAVDHNMAKIKGRELEPDVVARSRAESAARLASFAAHAMTRRGGAELAAYLPFELGASLPFELGASCERSDSRRDAHASRCTTRHGACRSTR